MTTAPQTPVVALTQLHKQFDATIALDGIDLVIDRPCIFGVVGPDGAGKTTLLRSLVGLLEFEAAQAHILGYDVVREPHRIRERLGYVPQAFGLYPELSVLHNLKFFADIHGITAATFQQRSEELLTIAGLEDFQARETGALSGGMKQKLAVICASILPYRGACCCCLPLLWCLCWRRSRLEFSALRGQTTNSRPFF